VTSIVVRDLDVDFARVPRHWLASHPVATAISNGINMLFPHGERFFVRSVNHFLPRITDPELRAQIKGFFGQEGRHARAHDQFNQILRAQGFEVDRFLERYETITQWIEARQSPELRLAITAAAEHFTAILAEDAFRQQVLDSADPRMRELLAWHASEELEHKAVAYDVLQQVNPSYALRVLGLVFAATLLGGFWIWASTTLLHQDGWTWRRVFREARGMPRREPLLPRVFAKGIRSYLRRDFHPSAHDTTRLAAEWYAARGMTLPDAA